MIFMLEPTLLKSLKLLRESREPLTSQDITERVSETKGYVEKALEKLIERDIVTKSGEFYSYRNTSTTEKFFEEISLVYDKVIKKFQKESLVIGLLSTAIQHKHLLRLQTLLEIIKGEGFDSKEVATFLEEETKNGRVGRFRIAIGTTDEALLPIPPVLPFYHISYFRQLKPNEYEKLKKEWLASKFFVQEEDYLVANYPDEIANLAREYLNEEASRARDRLREEAFEFWYRFRYGFRLMSLKICVSNLENQ